jgi:hypothetical protein
MRFYKIHSRLIIACASLLSACATRAAWREPGCATDATPPSSATPTAARPIRNVIIVTIDGVRWQEVFGGVDATLARSAGMSACAVTGPEALMPNVHHYFVEHGIVVGAPGYGEMVASGPNFVSLPGYEEIFTGRASRCTSNFCDHIRETTLIDELRAYTQLPPAKIAVITSWRTIERAAARDEENITISAGRHGGVTRDRVRVDATAAHLLDQASRSRAYPGWLDYRPDRYTAALALAYVAKERPRFLFVGLGDTDEYAHRYDYRGYVSALNAADGFVGALMKTLAALGDYGAATTVIVTTDHGRAAGFAGHGGNAPESQRVWMLVAGGAIPAIGFATTTRQIRLADIAPTVRAWLGIAPDHSQSAGVPVAELLPSEPPGAMLARAQR